MLSELIDIEEFPNTFNYLLLYGIAAAIPDWNLTNKWKTKEELYAECLRRGVKWQDIIEPLPNNVLL